eukprot:CAMPEP_0195524130 /NCGR_PEP_ID=MMETSP0794_2-20130614/23801_1 /TAXON_ID=515487 /ORGANISM="Stephanopyxis turris, Strain CCMP 815" /LENGTH=369 /DNA_ID=CAMNT_0040654291 /DNA_START=101 /DNA_END=1206 /DNA_ORIENTATION=+
MSSTPAVNAKEAGNALLKARNFEGAILKYSEAISLDGSQPTFYSNRALALSKLGRYSESVDDCNDAIARDPSFAKAYYYKADALLKCGNSTEAGKAAGVGLTKEPTDSVKKGLDQVITAASAATVTKPKGVKGVIQRAVEFQRFLAVILAVVYLIPIPMSFTRTAYRFSLFSTFAVLAYQMYSKHGKPWGMEFVRRILDPHRRFLDYTVHRLIMAAFLIVSKPYALGLFAVILPDVLDVLMVDVPKVNPLGKAGAISKVLHTKVLPLLLSNNTQNQHTSTKYSALRKQMMVWTAHLEIYLGLFLLGEIFTPGRSILQTVLLWQFLRTIAMFCQETRTAFWNVDQFIRGHVARVPAIEGYYSRFSAYLAT